MCYKRNKDKIIFVVIFLLVLFIGIGYAYLSSVLNITGNTQIAKNTWDIHFENITMVNNTINASNPELTTGDTKITFSPTLKKQGDVYEFTVDVVNSGTIDAMVSEVVKTGITSVSEKYLNYSVSYDGGQVISVKDKLKAGESLKLRVTLKYRDDSEAVAPSSDQSLDLALNITYVQDDGTGKDVIISKSFTEDSWDTIISAVKEGNTGNYHVGDTKEVDMGSFGTHKIRIANTTTPTECSTEGFSQTACGFVLEFADVITTHVMNSSDTNSGGWPASEMYTYVQNDIYNALPSDLKSGIIDTYVVSGHGSSEYTNHTSTDKLYLLATKEVWGKDGSDIIYYDTTDAYTRQLDYYKSQGVTTDNYSGAIKQYNGSAASWWLRAAFSNDSDSFYYGDGYYVVKFAPAVVGVSPAFRIG